jgi:hypothetical protein
MSARFDKLYGFVFPDNSFQSTAIAPNIATAVKEWLVLHIVIPPPDLYKLWLNDLAAMVLHYR